MIELTLSTGEPVLLKPSPLRNFRGTRLPGSVLLQAVRKEFNFSVQIFSHPLFQLSFRSIECRDDVELRLRETTPGLQLETVIMGVLQVKDQLGDNRFTPGQYQLTNSKTKQVRFRKGGNCGYLVANFFQQMFNQPGKEVNIEPTDMRFVSPGMKELIFELLDNPYSGELLPFYYENKIRELLFFHLSSPTFNIPGSLTLSDIAAVYESDRIIAENLGDHFTINVLARKAGTNAYVLKRGFRQLFGVGVFGRLLQKRMERAKMLLATTDKPIKDVSEEAGYETVAGFITAFRKRFGVTPKDWRKKQFSQE